MTPKITEQQKATNKLLRQEKLLSEFIKKSQEIHKDNEKPLYTYKKSIYDKASKKLIITCERHGDFLQTPNNHLNGHGCKKCGNEVIANKQLKSQDDFIHNCEEIHPGLLDFSKTIYRGRDKPTTFICKKCKTEYSRTPAGMLFKGCSHNCPKCIGNYPDTRETFIEKANRKHGGKFKYHLVDYINSLTKVKIECLNGHIFEQTPGHHLNGDGCRKCRGYYRTQEDFIILSNTKFSENPFGFSKLKFINMGTSVILICPNNHEFEVVPTYHLGNDSNGGCKKCQQIECSKRNSYTQDEWIYLVNTNHQRVYSYIKVNYINSQTNVIITCPKHGDFQQSPASHLSGQGCPKCGIERSVALKMLTEDNFVDKINRCKIVHNNIYKYNSIYRENGYLRIEIICEKHGIFNQRLEHHINGHGCYKCVSKYSKQQIEWLEYCQIRDGFIQHAKNIGEYQIPESFMHADGFRKETNTIYEYQGDFWHGNPKVFKQTDINPKTNTTYGVLFERTMNKIQMLRTKGYNIIEIWESDWERAKICIQKLQNKWKSNH